MKLLLAAINAKYIHSNLAVYNLKAYTKDLPVEVVLGEYTINQQSEEILRRIYEEGAQVVAFSCYIWNIDMVLSLAKEIKKITPKTRIWLGGPEASYDGAGLLAQASYIDLIMVGEGEETFYELVDSYMGGETAFDENALEKIDGIIYRHRKENKIIARPLRSYMDMDKIPFVYEDTKAFTHKIIYYETSRGCPFSCSYCLSSIDKRVRFRSLNIVFKELAHFLKEQVPQVKFVDRTFNCKHDHAYQIWEYIAEHDNGVTNFHFEISADLLREEDFVLFSKMRPGLIQLEIGVQSTYGPTIKEIHRTMQLSQLSKNVARVKKMHNIHQHLDLIAGLPFETLERFKNSFNDVYAMAPDQLQLGFLKVLKGSYMYEHKKEYEVVYTSRPPYEVLHTKWLTFDDVLILKDVEEMMEVYYNSGQFTSTLQWILPCFSDAYSFYEGLGAFYRQRGYFDCKHTRLARYDILREYVQECCERGMEKSAEKSLEKNTGMSAETNAEKNAEMSVEKSAEKNTGMNAEKDAEMALGDFILQQDKEEFLTRLDEYLISDIYLYEHSKKRPSWGKNEMKSKEIMSNLRSPKWRREHLQEDVYGELLSVLERKGDVYVEYLPNTMGGYVLFDYANRNPLTNAADTYMFSV